MNKKDRKIVSIVEALQSGNPDLPSVKEGGGAAPISSHAKAIKQAVGSAEELIIYYKDRLSVNSGTPPQYEWTDEESRIVPLDKDLTPMSESARDNFAVDQGLKAGLGILPCFIVAYRYWDSSLGRSIRKDLHDPFTRG